MERNDESLSTRELVPQDPTAGPVPDPEPEPRRREPQASDRAPMPREGQMRAPASASGGEFETQVDEGGLDTERPVREERNEPRLSSATHRPFAHSRLRQTLQGIRRLRHIRASR